MAGFDGRINTTPPGLQHITLHPKAERDTAMQNSSILKMSTIVSIPIKTDLIMKQSPKVSR